MLRSSYITWFYKNNQRYSHRERLSYQIRNSVETASKCYNKIIEVESKEINKELEENNKEENIKLKEENIKLKAKISKKV